MKSNLDIDITDPKKLLRARDELRRLLEIVEFALTKYGKEPHNSHSELTLPLATDPPSQPGSSRQILEVISKLPLKFTTSDVIQGLGEDGKDSRPKVKMILKQAVENGILRITSRGLGRRPSEYEKVTVER